MTLEEVRIEAFAMARDALIMSRPHGSTISLSDILSDAAIIEDFIVNGHSSTNVTNSSLGNIQWTFTAPPTTNAPQNTQPTTGSTKGWPAPTAASGGGQVTGINSAGTSKAAHSYFMTFDADTTTKLDNEGLNVLDEFMQHIKQFHRVVHFSDGTTDDVTMDSVHLSIDPNTFTSHCNFQLKSSKRP